MSRIKEKLDELKKEKRKALVPFLTVGYPSKTETINLMKQLEEEGADIIELGVPYSDPLADGKVIEKSYFEALKNNTKVKEVFEIIKEARNFTSIPIVIMVYFNVVYCYGIEKFIEKLSEVKGDGLIIPDLPLEERKELLERCSDNGIDLIPLVAPTSKERIEKIVSDATGFIYCVSVNGITGERKKIDENIREYIEYVKLKTEIPVLLGFGISNGETVEMVKEFCDGVIIGSAIIKRIETKKSGYNDIKGFMQDIKKRL